MSSHPHQPVLLEEAVRDLVSRPEGTYVDGTCGSGGHSEAIGRRLAPEGRLICLDRDPEAVAATRSRLGFMGDRARFFQANFADLDGVLEIVGLEAVSGVLLDLGLSSHQLEYSGRGFSFKRDEPLDMRMDREAGGESAWDLVNRSDERDLERMIRNYGEERYAGRIARAIVRRRASEPVNTTGELAELVSSVVKPSRRPAARHPATRTFQALRIAVNRELENLEAFLERIPERLERGGRLVVLSYHSLEDRRVKQAIRSWEKGCTCPRDFPVCTCGKSTLFKPLRREGLRPTKLEIEQNPRARSAVLRAAERL